MTKITVTVGNLALAAELDDSATGQAIVAALPISATASVWGDEIYFGIPVQMAEAPDAREIVEVGALAYWPPGSALCVFYGPTPASRDQRPRAYSPVNVCGRLLGDAALLRSTRSGARVHIVLADTE
jgi:hypothetical protein